MSPGNLAIRLNPSAIVWVVAGGLVMSTVVPTALGDDPVIANGKLYLRDQTVLLCYDVKRNQLGSVRSGASLWIT